MHTDLLDTTLQHLAGLLDGDLYDDLMMKSLYATDASVYRQLPMAVAFPKHTKDIQTIIRFASEHKLSVIPRAAGTSLAGQCVGDGIVVDISKYMNRILAVDPQEGWVRVQPSVIRDELNVFLEPYGLYFGPNTSTANRCNIGGMVGNNSCGTTSVVYGATRDHVLELKTVLSDGSEAVFQEMDKSEFHAKQQGDTLEASLYRHMAKTLSDADTKSQIREHFPKASVSRRNTGYAVDALLDSEVFSDSETQFNFCKLLCGSEGTLAFTTEVKLNVVPLPKPHDVVLAVHFESIKESMQATAVVMGHKPTACELMDKTILDCTKDNITQQKNRFFVEGDPAAILMVEFRADTLQEAKTLADACLTDLKAKGLGHAFPMLSGKQTKSVWDLRKAGLGLLANIPGDKKAVACIEDTAVAIEDLPAYIDDFSDMMKGFGQEAVYYAHAGAGELHLRPILNLKSSEDVRAFRNISEASARLVKQYKGSLSGEHGDGRVRAEFIPLVMGEANYKLFKEIKHTWDPQDIFNPGKIVDAAPMDTHLRYEPDVETPEIDTIFNFEDTGGILRTVEKCNGSGDCRKLSFAGGTMCPSYRATLDEKDTTRGRANILREFLTQNTKQNPFDHPEIKTAMDLCLSCKGCKSECPSNIDMARLKAEFQYQYQKQHGSSLRSKLIANNARLNALASGVPGLHNMLVKQSWFKALFGIARDRSLPALQSMTFKRWLQTYKQPFCERQVYLFCDEYTNYYDANIGKTAVKLFNALGYEVLFTEHPESGRAYISKGFLKQAKQIAQNNVSAFKGLISADKPLIGIEPSAILGFRDEYPDLVDVEMQEQAQKLSEHVMLIDEFISREIDSGHIDRLMFTSEEKSILLHGHCHQKALSSQHHTLKLLNLPENYHAEAIQSGCCGMAGSFGYEKEHYQLSQAIGNMVLFPAVNEAGTDIMIAANGTSCRHQIKDGTGKDTQHPVEILYNALK